MESSALETRLSALRRAVRRRLIAYGVLAAASGGVIALLTIIALDWLVWLPPLLRGLGAVLFVFGLGAASIHWVVKPARARLGLDTLAGRIERHFDQLEDRLASTVNFLERGAAGSTSMVRQVIARTEGMVNDLPLESVLTLRPLMMCVAAFLASACALATVGGVAPGWLRTGVDRYTRPWGSTEWPRRVLITPLTSDEIVALGESVTVRMRIDRGLHESLRGVVHIRESDGSTNLIALNRDRDGTFHTTIDTVTADLAYWFEAGDDSTAQRPGTIRAVNRPEVVEALVAIEPPPYAGASAVRLEDLADGPVNAPIGGHAKVLIRTSKSISTDAKGNTIGLRLGTDELIPLAPDPQDSRRLFAVLDVKEDVSFRAELVDEHGFENRFARLYTIRALPDAAPIVTILEPLAAAEVTPKGSVRLLVRVEDDFGVHDAALQAEPLQGGEPFTIPLTGRLRTSHDDRGVEALASYTWNMEDMGLAPGDVVVYEVTARDNRVTAEAKRQVGRSPSQRIKIISESEFEIRVREDLALLEDRLRRAAIEQAELQDATGILIQPDASSPTTLDDFERDSAATLASGQTRLGRQLREIARRLEGLAERTKSGAAAGSADGAEDPDRHIEAMAVAVRQIATGPMASASVSLNRARDEADAPAQQQNLAEAVQSQEVATDRLHALLRALAQWGSFRGLMSKTRDLLDRQDRLKEQTARLGGSMLGKPVESLAPEELAALRRTERRQERLADDVEQHLANMRRLSESTRDRNPAGAEAIDGALRVARAHALEKRIRSAADAIGANRTAAAGIDQRAAANGIRKMIRALRERERRELEELRKRLERAEDRVAELIARQESLGFATNEAELIEADEATFRSLAREQRTLARDTDTTGDDLVGLGGRSGRNVAAARLVRRAATSMEQAEVELEGTKADAADRAQHEALRLLRQALTNLEELARANAEEALRRSLAQIHEELSAMHNAQIAVNKGIVRLQSAIAERGRIGRSESREASKLAREQSGVREMVSTMLPDLRTVPVYEWALQRVSRWMDDSRNQLDDRSVDDDLVATTDRIAKELEKLIGAIVATQSLPKNTEFVEAESGGGGGQGGQPGTIKPVPTVAELLVLRAMQLDINARTKAFDPPADPMDATESDLRHLTLIGDDQAEVRRLAELVTNRARGH